MTEPVIAYGNSGGGLIPFDLAGTNTIRAVWGPTPEPSCRVCGQARSGLPGDTHGPCMTQLEAWRTTARGVFTTPETLAAQDAVMAAQEAWSAVVRSQLAALDVPEWITYEALRDHDDGW